MPPRTSNRFSHPLPAALAMIALLTLGGCSGRLPGVYRLDIQQGNVITQEMLDQLELGMDQRKVRFILGTPLLDDPFNESRWDYLYSFAKGGADRVQRHVSLYFENELLVRIEGDIRSGPTPEGVRPRQETIVTVPAERRKEGFFAGLVPNFIKRDPPARRGDAVQAGTAGAGGEPAADVPDTESEQAPLSAEDGAYLDDLFADYGKLKVNDGATDEGAEPVATRASESP